MHARMCIILPLTIQFGIPLETSPLAETKRERAFFFFLFFNYNPAENSICKSAEKCEPVPRELGRCAMRRLSDGLANSLALDRPAICLCFALAL